MRKPISRIRPRQYAQTQMIPHSAQSPIIQDCFKKVDIKAKKERTQYTSRPQRLQK